MEAVGAAMLVIAQLAVAVQPYWSVTVTLYVPAERTVIALVVELFDHA